MATLSLLIVESPEKAKTIQGYLDSSFPNQYEVKASVGHICDLPKKNLGFNTTTFEANYEVSEGKENVVRTLKSIARRCDNVILATDNDREGEAIAAHLKRELGLINPDRILFNQITKATIEKALLSPTKINQALVDSQETRRLLDRMIGWKVSPVARQYVVPESSMGRVQTAVLWMLVDLERRIAAFSSIKHFGVDAYMLDANAEPKTPWSASWDSKPWRGEDELYWLDRPSATKVSEIKQLTVKSVETGKATRNPAEPLITSTLQRAAEKSLGLTPKETMQLAQKLYESGAITYMRTDNPNLAEDTFKELMDYATAAGLPVVDKQRKFKAKVGAQEAHEAIRPTAFGVQKVGDGKIQSLYELIWNRAVACQLKAAEYDTRTVVLTQSVEVTIDGVSSTKTAEFKANGRVQTYAGWLSLSAKDFSEEENDEEGMNNAIPLSLVVGDVITLSSTQLLEKATKPPSRLTSSDLIKKLEQVGIGRPSTYASIIDTLEYRSYIRYEKKRMHVTDKGTKIIDSMEGQFRFIDVKYTADIENDLDDIAHGKKQWLPVTRQFWQEINEEVEAFVHQVHAKLPQHKCEECNSLIILQEGKFGKYWRCVDKSCTARYAVEGDAPGSRVIKEETSFPCVECRRNLIYRKGAFNNKPFEYFVCSGAQDATNPCTAKYEPLKGSNPVAPDLDQYREASKYKCLLCERRLVRLPSKAKPGTFFWMCSGNRKENPLCATFYNVTEAGTPDYEAFELNRKYKCVECQNFLSRLKYKEKPGHFWKCTHKSGKTECNSFYSDLEDGTPDFEKYASEHEHKCVNCDNYLRQFTRLPPSNDVIWICTHPLRKCGWIYKNVDNKPDIEAAKETYANKCPKCKLGGLSMYKPKEGAMYWQCSDRSCDHSFADNAGSPDLANPLPKKKSKPKAK